MRLSYPFTQAEAAAASQAWGCNCGPAALAFALRVDPDVVRPLIPHFDSRRYTSPTMMAAALDASGRSWKRRPQPTMDAPWGRLVEDAVSLVRVQWTGPWTAPGVNPRWAYRQSHWICGWLDGGVVMVFDVNGGIRTASSWRQEVVPPLLKACVPRADGGWLPTHCWQVVVDDACA